MTASPGANFWVVGVGSSAGGLEALTHFLRSLPANTPAAVIVAQHLSPHAKSMMVELLSRHSTLKTSAAQDHQRIEPGSVYIVPPNHDIAIDEGFMRLSPAGAETRPKPSVDSFFESLAAAYGTRAVGIILSGTGTDGSEGIRAIKQAGGHTLVQDSVTAKYDGMPRSAFETGMIDAVLPPDQLGLRLIEILKVNAPQSEEMASAAIGDGEVRAIIEYLRSDAKRDFTQYKPSTIRRRLQKRMAHVGIRDMTEYLTYLRSHKGESHTLAQELLVSVTEFFRDADAFEVFAAQLEKVIAAKHQDDELRVWIAGCATGEEAYTVAFIASDIAERLMRKLTMKIFATDLDQDALNQARAGLYAAADVEKVPDRYLRKYFHRSDGQYEVRKSIRDMLVFARQDLVQSPPFVRLDVITCRNVLIYFDTELQSRIFDLFHYALKPNGLLFLGKSENPPSRHFEAIDRKAKVYLRLNSVSKIIPTLQPHGAQRIEAYPSTRRRALGGATLADMAPEQVFKALDVCAVIMNEDTVIEHTMGNVGEFLQVASGDADFRLVNLVPKVAATELSALLRKVIKYSRPHTGRQHQTHDKLAFTFTVRNFEFPDGMAGPSRRLFLVTFEKVKSRKVPPPVIDGKTSAMAARVVELEEELAATREHLQTVIEELEISNEELQSLNEEMSSTNEELQASNEELETTNEEFQSTNEELTTLNEEINTKSAELRLLNTSLENILTSIGFPLLVVDEHLRIVRFNPTANMIFTLTASDLQQSILRASCHCEIEGFDRKLRETIQNGVVSEGVCPMGQNVFQLRIHPSRDELGKIIGAIIVFFDNTELMQAQQKLKQSDMRVRSIMDSSPTLISLKDALGQYLMVNHAFLKRFGWRSEDVIGKTDRDLFPEDVAQQFRNHDLEILIRRTPQESHEEFLQDGKKYVYLSSRFPLFTGDDKAPYAVGTVSLDVSSQIASQEALQQSEARYRAIVEDQAVFVCRHFPDGRLTFANSAFFAYFGGSSESNSRRDFLSLVEPIDRKRVREQIKSLSADQPVIQYEHRTQGVSSELERWVRWIHRVILNEAGEVVEYQAVGFDVTEIHNRTADLLEKENLFTRVLEHTSDVLTVYRLEDEDFILELFNPSASEIGLTPLKVGMRLSELRAYETVNEARQHLMECVRTKRVLTYDQRLETPMGERYYSVTMVPILDVDQRVVNVASVSRDISGLKNIQEELTREKFKADAANLAKSNFLATMSHELRTPLNVITGMSQLLARGKLDSMQGELVAGIQRSSKLLLSLIEDVLDLSKIDAGKVVLESMPVALAQLVDEVTRGFTTLAASKDIGIGCEIDAAIPPRVLGDPTRLRQVLTNLLGNAVKFTHKGSVLLKAERLGVDEEGRARVRFEVRDTGIGIPVRDFDKIFKRFSQADSGTSRQYGGSGLGLAICQHLVEMMGGRIGFDSREGEGSRFWFEVPFVQVDGDEDDAGEDADALAVGAEAKLNGLTILVVDDNNESLSVLDKFLSMNGSTVRTAPNGLSAYQIVRDEDVDIVLMDMQMPGLDGLQTTRMIRGLASERAKLPIIAVTANALRDDMNLCFEAGMSDYLSKPVNFQELTRTIAKWATAREKV